ncbi:MAG: cytochrome c [Bacteroidales bacterium]|nr:cytochrome c [Bacteroidales bacterium]
MRFINLFIILYVCSIGMTVSAQTWVVPDDQKTVVAPFLFTPEMQKQGEQIYLKNCQSCHGLMGKDNWAKLTPPPGDLSKELAQKQPDGELFYRITVGKAPMPEFRNILSEDERWWVIAYMRSYNPKYIQPNPATKASFAGRIVTLDMKYDDLGKKVVVTANEELKDGQSVHAAGVEVALFVKRFFGKLQVGELKTTNDKGLAIFEFPADLPGNKEGYVEVSAMVNDPKNIMKTTGAIATLAIGKPTDMPSLTEGRAWWATRGKAPVWIILTYTLSVIIVWGFIFYIVYSILKIRKVKKINL